MIPGPVPGDSKAATVSGHHQNGGLLMKKILLTLATLVVAFGMLGQTAEAAKKKTKVVVTPYAWWWQGPWTVRDPRLAASNFWVGAGSTGAYFALRDGHRHTAHGIRSGGAAYVAASVGCAAVSPIIGTLVVNRPLTQREVFVSTGNCFLPIVGGWMMNAWFDQNGWK